MVETPSTIEEQRQELHLTSKKSCKQEERSEIFSFERGKKKKKTTPRILYSVNKHFLKQILGQLVASKPALEEVVKEVL